MRAPFQVLVFPYQMLGNEPRFLIGCRSDDGVWQAVSGGGEGNESKLQAAKRELLEETGLVGNNWQKLDSICSLPKVLYKGHQNWNNHQFVIPEYCFSVQVSSEPRLSNEHTELRWFSYEEASQLLKYDSNRNALWEAYERLKYAVNISGKTALQGKEGL